MDFSSIEADEDAPAAPMRRSRWIIAQVCAHGDGWSAPWKIRSDAFERVAQGIGKLAAALGAADDRSGGGGLRFGRAQEVRERARGRPLFLLGGRLAVLPKRCWRERLQVRGPASRQQSGLIALRDSATRRAPPSRRCRSSRGAARSSAAAPSSRLTPTPLRRCRRTAAAGGDRTTSDTRAGAGAGAAMCAARRWLHGGAVVDAVARRPQAPQRQLDARRVLGGRRRGRRHHVDARRAAAAPADRDAARLHPPVGPREGGVGRVDGAARAVRCAPPPPPTSARAGAPPRTRSALG